MVLLSVLLTGFNIYPSLANWGGAGALVPITGFANGVAAPAIEFQKEGQVFGIGCKIFTIAGVFGAMAKHSDLRAQPCMPQDVANIILFLASDESRAITGQALVTDFGSTL